MSVRLEWTTTDYAAAGFYRRGEQLADGNRVNDGDVALVIGSQVVTARNVAELLCTVGGWLNVIGEELQADLPEIAEQAEQARLYGWDPEAIKAENPALAAGIFISNGLDAIDEAIEALTPEED